MPRRRRREPDPRNDTEPRPAPDRAWSARRNIHERDADTDLVGYTALPAETGPTWAPDQLSVWPVEGGRFGLDAHYEGDTGAQRAEYQAARLAQLNLAARVQAGPVRGRDPAARAARARGGVGGARGVPRPSAPRGAR